MTPSYVIFKLHSLLTSYPSTIVPWSCVFKTDMVISFVRDHHIYEENFIVRNCAEGEIWTPDQGLMSSLLCH